MQYMFQGWNMHTPGKYRDLVFGIASEEIGHVEMLAIMIAQRLEKVPLGITSDAVRDDPTVSAVIGGMDVQHAIVAGAGRASGRQQRQPLAGQLPHRQRQPAGRLPRPTPTPRCRAGCRWRGSTT